MKIYWTIARIPELAPLPPAERQAIWREAVAKANKKYRIWVSYFCMWFVMLLPMHLEGGFAIKLVRCACVGGLLGFIHVQFLIHTSLPYIREILKSRGAKDV